MSNDLIKFSASAGLHQPLRYFAPTSRAVVKCKRDLDTILNPYNSDQIELSPKEMHELILPRIGEVLSAVQLLDTIMNGGEVIPPEAIIDLLKILQATISTQKKSEEETAASMLGGTALFDFDIDSAGADLEIWDATPRHPMVVAFAIHALINKSTFSPSLAELASACRFAHYRLETAFGIALDWLDRFNQLDASLAMRSRESHDEWARGLTLEKIATIEAINELLRYFKRSITREFDTTRLQEAEPKKYPLREMFFAAIKNKLERGDELILSDAEIESIAASCGWESWQMQEARKQERAERYREEERLEKERERLKQEQEQHKRKEERLWERRRHQCAYCRKGENQLFGINLFVPKPEALLRLGMHPRPRLKPVAICNECLESDPCEGAELICSFCDAEKPAVLNSDEDAICRACFDFYVEEFRKWSYPVVDFTIGKRGALTETFAKDKAKQFNAFVKQKGKAAIDLKIDGFPDDYGQPLYNDEAPAVAAYVRSWARFAKLDLKRAVQLFGPDTWGGNTLPETLHFLMMCDAVGVFRAQLDELSPDECVEVAVKLCADR
jgi:hypothetical protein